MNFKNLSREVNRLENKKRKAEKEKERLENKLVELQEEQNQISKILEILSELKTSWKNQEKDLLKNFCSFLTLVNGEARPAIPIEFIDIENGKIEPPSWIPIVCLDDEDLLKTKCPYCGKDAYIIRRFFSLCKTGSMRLYREEFLIICCDKLTVLNTKEFV